MLSKGRQRKYLNLIVDAFHAFDFLHHVFSIRLKRRARYLPNKCRIRSIHLACEIVEHAQKRQHDQFVPDLILDMFHRGR